MVSINLEQGGLPVEEVKRLQDEVKEMNKKLYLPQIYDFVVEQGQKKASTTFSIVKVRPYTQPLVETVFDYDLAKQKQVPSQPKFRSAIKIFQDSADNFVLQSGVDGFVFEYDAERDFDFQVLALVEAAVTLVEKPVIFKLSDLRDQKGGFRGGLRLLSSKSVLSKEVEALLFVKNKKQLLNISFAFPFVRSVNEFIELKKELAVRGLSRKGSFKLWLELSVPENILNLEEYVKAGFDGVAVNLDELAKWVGGFDPEVDETYVYQKSVGALVKLLEQAFKVLHQEKIPILASGKLAQNDEMLTFLVEKGVYAVSASQEIVPYIGEHLRFIEKRLVRKRMS
ncbi:MAG: hypothetical protein ACD_30C00065G0003 [uncultured bacterium]|nr:MAG: hypothetical protein ACD_30C00065G0003 [uncultured bacterium]